MFILFKHKFLLCAAQAARGGKGRISIILWGLCDDVVEEEGSPPMLTDDSRGGKGGKGGGKGGKGDVCFDFQKGSCSRGEGCRFTHAR